MRDGWTKEEASLLLYLEHCCVDNSGQTKGRKLNDDDIAILDRWDGEGFIEWRPSMGLALLTERAFACAHVLRLQKARRSGTVWLIETQEALAKAAKEASRAAEQPEGPAQ